ncbi:MAG: Uma2 family endonuclease [Myxococcota bacterium]|nr:Uma2 family endonuclease [Myxococcota bacterium]
MVDPARDLGVMTYAAYLELERSSATKHEYVNGRAYAMAGGTPEHARLQLRLGRALGPALDRRGCEGFSSDLRVRIVATGRSTYPDLSVVCGSVERAADDPDAATNPIVIAEILSESTEAEDRGSKWLHYQRIPSLRHYVLVSQRERRVEVYTRDGTTWRYDSVDQGGIALSAIEATLSLDELYRSALSD